MTKDQIKEILKIPKLSVGKVTEYFGDRGVPMYANTTWAKVVKCIEGSAKGNSALLRFLWDKCPEHRGVLQAASYGARVVKLMPQKTVVGLLVEGDELTEIGKLAAEKYVSEPEEEEFTIALPSVDSGSLHKKWASLVKEVNRYRHLMLSAVVTQLRKMDVRLFEDGFLRWVLEGEYHCRDVEITRQHKDGGVDARCVTPEDKVMRVQAKRWTANVGPKEIRELRGSGPPEELTMVVTTGGFTSAAVMEAGENHGRGPTVLVGGRDLAKIVLQQHKVEGFGPDNLTVFRPGEEFGG